MTKTVIDRLEWGRGNTTKTALLDYSSNLKCCLGFECLSRGFAPASILGAGLPSTLYFRGLEGASDRLGNLVVASGSNSRFSFSASAINDTKHIDILRGEAFVQGLTDRRDLTDIEELREAVLTELFAKNGVELTFIN